MNRKSYEKLLDLGFDLPPISSTLLNPINAQSHKNKTSNIKNKNSNYQQLPSFSTKTINKTSKITSQQSTNHPTLIHYNNELLIDHRKMDAIKIAIVGENEFSVLRLYSSICNGQTKIPTDKEFQHWMTDNIRNDCKLDSYEIDYKQDSKENDSKQESNIILKSETIDYQYRTRLIPMQISIFIGQPSMHSIQAMKDSSKFTDIQIWIIVIDTETSDLRMDINMNINTNRRAIQSEEYFMKYRNVSDINSFTWNTILNKNFISCKRMIACIERNDIQTNEENISLYREISYTLNIKIKHVSLFNKMSIGDLFERAISLVLDDIFCKSMKEKYFEYCAQNIKYSVNLWSFVEHVSPIIWMFNLMFNAIIVINIESYIVLFLILGVFLLLNVLLTYQLIKIYCNHYTRDVGRNVCVFGIGVFVGFLIPMFAYLYDKFYWFRYQLSRYVLLEIDDTSLDDFSSNAPVLCCKLYFVI